MLVNTHVEHFSSWEFFKRLFYLKMFNWLFQNIILKTYIMPNCSIMSCIYNLKNLLLIYLVLRLLGTEFYLVNIQKLVKTFFSMRIICVFEGTFIIKNKWTLFPRGYCCFFTEVTTLLKIRFAWQIRDLNSLCAFFRWWHFYCCC